MAGKRVIVSDKFSQSITTFSIRFFKVPKHNVEYSYNTYEVLCGSPAFWYPMSAVVPKVKGGEAGNGEPFYVCKANIGEESFTGKLYLPTGCCYVPSNGKEHCIESYFVLSECCVKVELVGSVGISVGIN